MCRPRLFHRAVVVSFTVLMAQETLISSGFSGVCVLYLSGGPLLFLSVLVPEEPRVFRFVRLTNQSTRGCR